ncbi:hypothetical protein CCR95_14780 [Thiocystis minor]|jgi:predicted HTH domain antitoxin|uniref:UPF0175 family protein n=1 Tax=Thiocystis minor TaxID=61597 RepID=UPI0019145D7D|nr:UPF0175 family protein [Thiocystis minor]MBK5965315.1 hypothetical protein [Thiocystis minor]
MQIAINLPNDFVEMQTASVIEREMRASYALALFKAGRITLSKGAQLADLTVHDFMKSCKDSQIPVIDMTREELMEDLESMRQA